MESPKTSVGAVDPHDLERFVEAQATQYRAALAEIRNGWKASHWMWFIFPQLLGLGASPTSRHYAIKSRSEAEAYLAHQLLGPRLIECTEAVLHVQERSAVEVFGALDAMKLRSCATLFAQVSPAGSSFHRLIDQYFGGQLDERTLQYLAEPTHERGFS